LDLAEFHQAGKSPVPIVIIQFVSAPIDEKLNLLAADKSGVANQT
jgi:hypothetical protein